MCLGVGFKLESCVYLSAFAPLRIPVSPPSIRSLTLSLSLPLFVFSYCHTHLSRLRLSLALPRSPSLSLAPHRSPSLSPAPLPPEQHGTQTHACTCRCYGRMSHCRMCSPTNALSCYNGTQTHACTCRYYGRMSFIFRNSFPTGVQLVVESRCA